MAVANIYTCNKCKGIEQSEEFRLNAANFNQVTFSMYPVSGGGPMMPGGMPGGAATNRNETFHICSECKAAFDIELDALVNPLKA